MSSVEEFDGIVVVISDPVVVGVDPIYMTGLAEDGHDGPGDVVTFAVDRKAAEEINLALSDPCGDGEYNVAMVLVEGWQIVSRVPYVTETTVEAPGITLGEFVNGIRLNDR